MRRRRGLLTALVVLPAVALGAVLLLPAEPITPTQALGDFERLKAHLARAWANMEWIAGQRGVDLAAAARRAEGKLRQVEEAGEARRIIQDFLRSFRDPHLHARPVEPSLLERLIPGGGSSHRDPVGPEASPRKACKALGFRSRDLDFGLRFPRQPGYEAVDSDDGNPFQAGLLPMKDGRRLGLLRIAHFGEDGYPGVCREKWKKHRREMKEPCRWCRSFRMRVRDRLLAYLTDRLRALQSAGYDMLVVDITGNGGGTDWVLPAARIVSPGKLSCSMLSFVKHPHWGKMLRDDLEAIREEMTREVLSGTARETLAAAGESVEVMIAQAQSPCDRMPMWEGKPPAGGCSNLVDGAATTCGLFPRLEPGALDGMERPGVVYKAFDYAHRESVNRRPLAILIDRGTASASEDFASILQDNGAAVILGSRSYGAGCGFVNGGIPLILEEVSLRVMAPDCVRFRRDGTNEIEGVKPDIDLDWDGDSAKERTRKALAVLNQL